MPTLKVSAIRQDTPNLKTYTFEYNLRAKPGQFVMVWLPGVDEVPMSIGWQTDQIFELGITDAGDCTHAIHERVKVGDKLGIRGPYGTYFDISAYDQVIGVGGGCGTLPILNLAQRAVEQKKKFTMIQGARCRDLLLYGDLFAQLKVEVRQATNDGSIGHKGYCTELLEAELKKPDKKKKTVVCTCGPEGMMVSVAKLAEKYGVDSLVSLERYMKCGFGICGQCCMDDTGFRVCKDGPVVSGKIALGLAEFGKYDRSASGKRSF